jgi:uncharacterized protein YxeA
VLSLVELKENPEKMKKIMIAALGLSLLSGTAVFAQNTTSTDTGTMKSKKSKHKKAKKSSTATDTAASK